MKHIITTASLLALFTVPSVWAQTDTDDEVVSVGSRISGLSLDATTSAITLLTEEQIQARGQAFLSDILRSLPGLAVSRSGPAGNLTQIRVRGSEANHVLVIIDGVEAGNPNTGEFDFAGIRSEDIVKIEVLRGEQSALWGSDAIGGVINIITRAGSHNESYQASAEIGSNGTIEGQVSAVIPIGTAALSLNGNAVSTRGFDISGLDGESDGSQSRSISLGLNNIELGPIKLSALYSASNLRSEFDSDDDGVFSFSDPSFPFGVFISDGRLNNTDNLLITDNRRANITGRFKAGILNNKISLSLTETATRDPNADFQNDTQGRRLQANWASEASIADVHKVTLLAEVENEDFETFGGDGAGQNQEQNITNYAIAGDYRFDHNAAAITGSIRQDFNEMFDDTLTWRVGASYKVDVIDGRLYGSYGTGVKNPTFTEIFGFFPAFFVGNPNIQPERSEGFNIGYSQGFASGKGSISVDYFQSDLENEIITDFSVFPSTVVNLQSDSSRKGVEVEGSWSPIRQFDIGGALTFLDAEEGEITEIRRPDFTGRANITWRPIDAFSLTATLDHTGSQTDTDFATPLNTDGTVALLLGADNQPIVDDFGGFTALPVQTVELSSFTLIGANISYNINDVLTVSVRGENLLDEEYQEIVGFTSPGRQIFGGVRAKF